MFIFFRQGLETHPDISMRMVSKYPLNEKVTQNPCLFDTKIQCPTEIHQMSIVGPETFMTPHNLQNHEARRQWNVDMSGSLLLFCFVIGWYSKRGKLLEISGWGRPCWKGADPKLEPVPKTKGYSKRWTKLPGLNNWRKIAWGVNNPPGCFGYNCLSFVGM